jgi:hypothetical protein
VGGGGRGVLLVRDGCLGYTYCKLTGNGVCPGWLGYIVGLYTAWILPHQSATSRLNDSQAELLRSGMSKQQAECSHKKIPWLNSR